MIQFEVPEPDYDRYTNRQLVALPLAVLAVALAIIAGMYLMTGAPAVLGIEFTGGTELTVETADDREAIEAAFDRDVEEIREVDGVDDQFILTFGPEPEGFDGPDLDEQAEANLAPAGADENVVQGIRGFDETFGADTQQLALVGLVVAFLGMSILAFILFRTFIPSIAIVASAFSDIMIPLAAMNLLGIELTVGTVAALLMLIGYSVDSDILLNNHILRRGGDFYESTYRAMNTGVTMTVTSMTAMAVMAIVGTFFGIDLLAAIGLILFIGLAADLMNTYMLNLSLLRWYKFHGVKR